jgi:hypothetical protein
MSAAGEKELRRHWIDDLLPENSKSTNDGLRVEGAAHVMGNPNGRFGTYRFFALVSWRLVRHRDREPIIEHVDLNHSRRELVLVVSTSEQMSRETPTAPDDAVRF